MSNTPLPPPLPRLPLSGIEMNSIYYDALKLNKNQ